MAERRTIDPNLLTIRKVEEDIRAGRLKQAANAIDALRLAAPGDVRVHLTEALLARSTVDPDLEIAALQRAASAAPRWPLPLLELAKALSRRGLHTQAVAMADQAVALAPQEMSAIEIAAAVANEAGDRETAQRHLETAFALRPNEPSIRRALGVCLAKQGRYAQAETHWRALLAETADDRYALGWLGVCLTGLDRREEACHVLNHALALYPDDPSLSFHLAIARGETPRTQPRELMQQLFDDYAGRFDAHLVRTLKYFVPERVAQIIAQRHPDRNLSVLDLGCGTGLLGEHLGAIRKAFVGIDLSAKMIEQSARRGMYTQLRQADLLDELRATASGSFDCIVANDVFIYVGDVSEVIPVAFAALSTNGALIFSCETAEESEGLLVLRASKRYAHAPGWVQKICHDAGFSSCTFEPVQLRFDGSGRPVAGFIAIAEKS